MRTIDATSIGNIACNLQTGVRNVERIAAALKLEPVLILDHVRHYCEEQVEQIRAELNGAKR
jgi:hypothetical protein